MSKTPPDPSRSLDRPPPGSPYDVPPEGSLALLALGARGIEAWRARRAEHKASDSAPTSATSSLLYSDRPND